MALVIGSNPLEQPLSYTLDRVNGNSYTRTWIGSKAVIEALAAIEEPFAESINVNVEGLTGTLKARYARSVDGSEETPLETHELGSESLSQSIFLNPTFAALPQAIIEGIRRIHENPPERTSSATSYQLAVEVIQEAAALVDPAKETLAIRAYDLLVGGTESFELHSFVFKRTRTVSRQYSQKIPLADLDKTFTTAQLSIETGNPVLFDVPSLALTPDEAAKNLMAGWRKKECNIQDVSNGTRQVIEIWQLAKWSLDLYPAKA